MLELSCGKNFGGFLGKREFGFVEVLIVERSLKKKQLVFVVTKTLVRFLLEQLEFDVKPCVGKTCLEKILQPVCVK